MTEKTISAIDTHRKLGYNTVEVKNYWRNKRNPYNGVNTILRSPDGQTFEIQYYTPESYKIKDKMHSDYEKWRIIDDKSSMEAQELRESMFELSPK